jgi:prepilin-type N-terminal cleavage/methylation domain-containing protein
MHNDFQPIQPNSVEHSQYLICTSTCLEGTCLEGAVLEGTGLEGTVLEGTVLEDAVLEGAVLEGAVLEGAVLEGAVLEGTVLKSPVLERPVLESPVLKSPVLKSPILPNTALLAHSRLCKQNGFSLIEVLVVVLIVAILTAIALPAFAPIEDKQIKRGIHQMIQAIEFARAETMRTNKPHGVTVRLAEQDARVYWLDTSGATPVKVYDVRHPISKSIYSINYSTTSFQVALALVNIRYHPNAILPHIEFHSSHGVNRINDNGTLRPFKVAEIEFSLNNIVWELSIDEYTGRITYIEK